MGNFRTSVVWDGLVAALEEDIQPRRITRRATSKRVHTPFYLSPPFSDCLQHRSALHPMTPPSRLPFFRVELPCSIQYTHSPVTFHNPLYKGFLFFFDFCNDLVRPLSQGMSNLTILQFISSARDGVQTFKCQSIEPS